jgi:hypothetical protein
LQRPQWRDVARVIGAAPVTRAILAAGGSPANPLKIYLPHVDWVQPRSRAAVIYELDVVGTRQRLTLASEGSASTGVKPARGIPSVVAPAAIGVAMPRSMAPKGATLISRVRVYGWVVAKFRLRHPWRIDLDQLNSRASLFFRHTPQWVLAFVQRPGP